MTAGLEYGRDAGSWKMPGEEAVGLLFLALEKCIALLSPTHPQASTTKKGVLQVEQNIKDGVLQRFSMDAHNRYEFLFWVLQSREIAYISV